jgi:CelD/BcsL family acetyltransferase involved in cellulose biosynthesis
MLRVQVIEDEQGFLALREQWQELLQRSHQNHFYLTHAYLSTWWKQFADAASLRIVVVAEDDRILAIAPLMRSRGRLAGLPVRRIESLGTGWGYGGIIVSEKTEECLRQIFDRLLAMGDWDLLYLPKTLGDASVASREIVVLDPQARVIHEVDPTRVPYISLETSWDEYLSQRASKFRRNTRSRERKLQALGTPVYRRIRCLSEAGASHAQVMSWLRAIADRSWKAESGTAISSTPHVFDFYSELALGLDEEGQLDVCFLFVGDRPVAYTFGALYNHDYYEIDIAYDRELAKMSPGTLLRNRLLQELFDEGLNRFDFVMDYDYKKDLTTDSEEFCTHFVYRKRPYPLLLRYLKQKVQPSIEKWRGRSSSAG